MKRRILTVLCALALLVGAFGIVAAAVDANAVAVIGNTGYSSLQDAVDAIEEGATGLIELKKSTDETVTVTCDVYVDLAGNSIAGIDVTAGTFYGMDSATIIEAGDDANVSYGKIASVKGAVKPISVDAEYSADSYLMAEDNGTSFHAVNLRLTDMSLRPEKAGVYFKSDFAGDSVVASKVKKFGVALSIKGIPTAENIKTSDCARSSFTGFTAGVNNNATSTLLSGIMKEDNKFLLNKRNSEMPVYGRAYVELKDGTFIFGAAENRSLKEQTQMIGAEKVTEDVVTMYEIFKSVMMSWDQIDAIQSAYQVREDETLKVLLIGNSHGLDATRLLYEVFKQENPDQKVVIGALYVGGCSIARHAIYAKRDYNIYAYHKNGDYHGANEDGSWQQTGVDTMDQGVSMRYALQDESWDIVIMQQMNRQAAIGEELFNSVPGLTSDMLGYVSDDFKTIINHIYANVEPDTKLGWHMVWANPDDEIYYTPDSNLSLGGSSAVSWGEVHTSCFSGEDGKFSTSVMYEEIVKNTQEYIVDSTEFLGEDYFDLVMHSATAVQYALDKQDLAQNQVYRDYTHISFYSRLMVAYVWYAELMEAFTGEKVDIKAINIDKIPSYLGIGYSSAPSLYPTVDANGDYPLTPDMKTKILEAVRWTLANPYSLPEA